MFLALVLTFFTKSSFGIPSMRPPPPWLAQAEHFIPQYRTKIILNAELGVSKCLRCCDQTGAEEPCDPDWGHEVDQVRSEPERNWLRNHDFAPLIVGDHHVPGHYLSRL